MPGLGILYSLNRIKGNHLFAFAYIRPQKNEMAMIGSRFLQGQKLSMLAKYDYMPRGHEVKVKKVGVAF